jgi:hypothetical protein
MSLSTTYDEESLFEMDLPGVKEMCFLILLYSKPAFYKTAFQLGNLPASLLSLSAGICQINLWTN